MSPVSRRRQTKRPKQRWEGTHLLPLGNIAAETADVVGACDFLLAHLDGTLAQRGIDASRYIALLVGTGALVGVLAERMGVGPDSNPDGFRDLLTEIRSDHRLTPEWGGTGPLT